METLVKFIVFLFLFFASNCSARTLDQQPYAVDHQGAPDPHKDMANLAPFATPISTQHEPNYTLSFFMHDILGVFNPSARAVTGIVNNVKVNSLLPFAKPNGGITTVNTIPFLTGLNGPTSNVFRTNGGPRPIGFVLPQLMFGTITVIDDELTEGQELGSRLIGKAQGFYVASSVDGNSQSMAFTAMFESGNYVHSLSFLGVHRIGVSESQLAIMGGTGKYVNAKGHSLVKTITSTNQQVSDDLETVLEFFVYVTF